MVENQMPFLIVAILALAVIGGILFVMFGRRNADTRLAKTPTMPAIQDVTVVFRPEHRGSGSTASYVVPLPDDDGAYLIPLFGDDGTPGRPIPLESPSLTIGRDQSRAQIVFTDATVSRLHARLVEEIDGIYMLHDEGSASGTFVNDEPLDLQPRQLHSGDLIEFGRQRVIFHSSKLFGDDAPLQARG